MAARTSSTYWRTILKRMEGNRMFATSTAPKMEPVAATADHATQLHPQHKAKGFAGAALKGDYVPIYMTWGMVMIAVALGVHTAKQQLTYCPSVHVSKKKREMLPEVESPDRSVAESEKFVGKSILRKFGHIQDPSKATLVNPIQGDPVSRPRHIESLKSVGVGTSNSHH